MAVKNALLPHKIIDAKSMSTSLTSDVTDVRFLDSIAMQINFTTSDAVGTFSVQGSLDYVPTNPGMNNSPAAAGNWIDMGLSIAAAASANNNILINMNQVAFPYIRLVYTRTSGTGTMTVLISGKEI